MARSLAALLLSLLSLTTAAAAAEDGVLAELPFLDEVPWDAAELEDHILIDLSPHPGKPLPMVLDTGAEVSMMTPRWARHVGVSVRRTKETPYRRGTVLGRDLQFQVTTGSSDTAARTFEAGLLGGDFLREYVVEVDYQARRVRFLDPERHPVSKDTAEPGELVVPMRLTNTRPELEIALGSGSLHFLVDTGAPAGLYVSEEGAAKLGIEVAPGTPIAQGRNVLGSDRWALQQLPEVRIGDHAVRDVALGIALKEGSSYRVTNIAGVDQALLGNEFLRRFRVRFDYPNGRMALLPVAQPDEPRPAAPPPAVVSLAPAEIPTSVPPSAPIREAPPAPAEEVLLQVDAPTEGALIAGPVGWLEVRGWAGARRTREYDIVIVVDVSGSTAIASGVDVDGDGKLGKKRIPKGYFRQRKVSPRHLSSDLDDSILGAEITAVRRLVEVLDPERTRIGLVDFAYEAQLSLPLGSDRDAYDRVLHQIEQAYATGATNFEHAIRVATEALVSAGAGEPDPPDRVVLFLSDGYPTYPGNEEVAVERALTATTEAAAADVRIFTFALGVENPDEGNDDVFTDMAELTGGSNVRLVTPGDVIQQLPRIDLARLAGVDIQNVTLGEPGRATRVFPDGSFDSYVKLTPGENVLRVLARGEDGGERVVEQRVRYERREAASPEEEEAFAARAQAIGKALRTRTLETELSVRARERQAPQGKDVEVEVDDALPSSP